MLSPGGMTEIRGDSRTRLKLLVSTLVLMDRNCLLFSLKLHANLLNKYSPSYSRRQCLYSQIYTFTDLYYFYWTTTEIGGGNIFDYDLDIRLPKIYEILKLMWNLHILLID